MADMTNHIKTILEADAGNYQRVMDKAAATADKFDSSVGGKMKGFASKFTSSFKSAGSGVGGFISKVSPVANKVGNVMTVASTAVLAGTAAMGKAFVGFAGDALKSAADMQALNSQYGQVFKGMEEQANSSINAIAKDTNILPQRLKPAFTQMAAFAKTAGFDTKDALDLSSRATKAAADSAAYYDRSLGDVTESLQSYLKGNYENDAALGLSSTETTRNAAANKLYGKSFNDLSEAQKQLTLLQMVEDANKLSGALGQASREGNGWENVMGNIQAGIDGFKAAVAGPFLDPLMSALSKLTPLFGTVQEKIQKFFQTAKGQAIVKQFSDTINVLADRFAKFVEGIDIGAIADQFGKFVNSFTGGDLPGTISKIAEQIGVFVGWVAKMLPLAVKMAPTLLKVGLALKAFAVLAPVVSFISSLVGIFTSLMPVITAVGGAITTVVGILGGPLTIAIAAAVAAGVLLYKNWDTVVQWATKLWNWIKEAWAGIVEATVNMASNVAQWFSDMKDKAVAKATELVDGVIKWYNSMKDKASKTVSSMVDAIVKWWDNLKSSVVRFASTMVNSAVQKFNDLKAKAVSIINGMVTSVVNFFQRLLTRVQSIINNVRNAVSRGFSAVKSIATNLISNTVTAVVNIFGRIVGGIRTNMSKISSAVSSGIRTAYNTVINWGKTFFNAGANIVGMIAGGIKSAIGKVTSAIGDITQKIRNFLPFSPAKEGPLRDLNKLNFGGTISQGIYNAKNQVAGAMNDILGIPDLTEPNLAFGSGSGVNYKYTTGIDNRLRVDLYATTEIDGREVARTTQKDMTDEQNRKSRTQTRAAGYRS